MNAGIDRNHIETLFENRFLKVYDLQYAEGKHYFEASRRGAEDHSVFVCLAPDGIERDGLAGVRRTWSSGRRMKPSAACCRTL